MNRTIGLLLGLLVLWGLEGFRVAAAEATTPRRPNVLLIVADDLGYGDLGCYGARQIRTPHLDRLAAQGVRFTDFYANAPECTPTRTALMTGRYQQRVGGLECAIGFGNVGRYDDAVRLQKQDELGLPATELTLPQLLHRAGYTTALAGKWHLGYLDKFSPLRHGFQRALYILGGGVDYFYHCEPNGLHTLRFNQRPIRRDGQYMTHLITQEALAFLRRHDGSRPFFLYVPYTAPHFPYQGPNDRRLGPLPPEEFTRGDYATYRVMVEEMDRGIGQLLAELDRRRWRENTLVIFFSDNGPTPLGSAGPFRGHKGGTFEGGIRVPAIVRWPKRLPEGTVTRQVTLSMDLTASVLAAAGVKPPRPLDGIDVLPLVARGSRRPRTVFWRQRRGQRTWWAVRQGAWKYVRRRDGQRQQEFLFHLEHDPGEAWNRLHQRPEVATRLRRLLAEWERRVRSPR